MAPQKYVAQIPKNSLAANICSCEHRNLELEGECRWTKTMDKKPL
jgi:hypothetical protein